MSQWNQRRLNNGAYLSWWFGVFCDWITTTDINCRLMVCHLDLWNISQLTLNDTSLETMMLGILALHRSCSMSMTKWAMMVRWFSTIRFEHHLWTLLGCITSTPGIFFIGVRQICPSSLHCLRGSFIVHNKYPYLFSFRLPFNEILAVTSYTVDSELSYLWWLLYISFSQGWYSYKCIAKPKYKIPWKQIQAWGLH